MYVSPEKFSVGDLVSDGFETFGIVMELAPCHAVRIHKTTRYLVRWINSINHNEQWMFGVDLELESRV
jgi:hypothetical protein